MDTNTRLAAAVVFTWLGMVLAISFVEALVWAGVLIVGAA